MGRSFKSLEDRIARLEALVESQDKRIEALEKENWALKRANDMARNKLEMSDSEWFSVYERALGLGEKGGCPKAEEQAWADFFFDITYTHLEKLHSLTDDKTPWFPFLRLATLMHCTTRNKGLKEFLDAGIRRLQSHALMWQRERSDLIPSLLSFTPESKKTLTRLQTALSVRPYRTRAKRTKVSS